MKKIIVFILSAMLLTACDNADIGIIGGADGPTTIFIGENNVRDTSSELEYNSFIGTVLEEATTYMIVEPNEDEAERKSSDKIRVNYGSDHLDYLYGVGRKVIINYTGFIKETYPAQIDTDNIETDGYDDFSLIVKSTDKLEKKKILNNTELYKNNSNFDLYYMGVSEVNVFVDNKEMPLEEALRKGYLTLDGIISKISKETDGNEGGSVLPYYNMYKDGGTMEYQYEDYTIIKYHSLNGNRDVYICKPGTKLNDLD